MADTKDRMAKARAAKKPPTYKNIHEDVKALDDDHYLSVKNVKEWEKHNKERVKELFKEQGDDFILFSSKIGNCVK